MKIKLLYLLGFLFLFSCSTKENKNTEPPPLYTQAKSFTANPEGGYAVNVVTGDSIKPLINSLGDTLKTGVQIPAIGKVIHPDSVSQPKSFPVPSEDKLIRINAHPNVQKIPDNLTVIPVNQDSLTVIPIVPIEKGDKSHFILNSQGDTIPTGVPIPATGKVVKAIQPKAVKALSPRFKDNAINNMQFLDVDQGMNSSYVFSILEDKSGNLWFGTDGGGVSKYDGASFSHYTEKEGLSNNRVWSILEDKSGNLWFGTLGGGVSKYDGTSFSHYTEKEGLSNNRVWSILEDKSGNLWFGTDGGGVSKYDGTSFTHYTEKEGLSNNIVWSILEDTSGNLWFGTNGGGVSKYDGASFSHYREKEGLPNNYVWSILEDKSGNLWFGTYGGGVSKYDGASFSHYTEKEGLPNNYVYSILEDKSGNLWFGTYGGGVSKYDGASLPAGQASFSHYTEKEGLSNNYVRSILEDKSGNLWFGTNGGGVSKYDGTSFSHYTEKEGLSNNYVRSILEDKSGNLWFGTDGGGVSKYDGTSFTHYTEKEGLSNNRVWSILEDKSGNLWFGTLGGGVSKYDGTSFSHYTEKEGLSDNYVWSILEDKSGNLWFGTYGGGVSKYDGASFSHYTEKEGLSNNYVRSILEDKSGNLWFGTNGGGVSKYDGTSFSHYTEKEGLSNNYVRSILEDKSGNLWFGTNGGGVSKYDGTSFAHYTEKEGLTNNIVWSILEDTRGKLWASTENGISGFANVDRTRLEIQNTENTEKFTLEINRFEKNDGLKGMDFYSNSACLDSKNRMWWGSGKALTMLDMNDFQLAQNPPELSLRGIDINDNFIDFGNISDSLSNSISFDGVQKFENYPLNLELSYDQNHLTFHFSAIDWHAPHKILYSFRLLGQSEIWSNPSAETKADFRDLDFGEYNFQIRAIGESGEWSEAFEYEFKIHPPWWHTWWARALYALFALTLILTLVRWRTAQLKERQKELEVEVDIATKEIRQQKEVVEKQKEIVEEAHREITDSIAYAKRIQSAILPPMKLVKEYLHESFILYKPKDVVAGDFYWMMPQKDRILFAAADCTGHGVPGAMVSVVCNNGLNRSVREHGLTDPGQILDKTREIVIEEFEKSEEDVKDGMDIALCSLEGNTLKYAGAHNPLYIIRKGATEVEEIKANKQPIGKFDELLPYTTHTVSLNSGDSIYLFSDGFVDQFGGEKGKKLKAPNFRKLLLGMQDQSMEKQHQLLDKAFEDWKGELEQIDDVCVIGVRL